MLTHQNMANHSKPSLNDIAAYVPHKCIIDKLANKLSKEELIELLARKVEIKQSKHCEDTLRSNEKVKKWKLIQYGADDKVIENQEIPKKMKRKIKKYLRQKNQLRAMEEQKERKIMKSMESETADHDAQMDWEEQSENAEPSEEVDLMDDGQPIDGHITPNVDRQTTSDPAGPDGRSDVVRTDPQETTENLVTDSNIEDMAPDPLQNEQRELLDVHLSTTITGDISFRSKTVDDDKCQDQKSPEKSNQNTYQLTMDVFDCGHLMSSKTICTQTSLSDVRLDTKFKSPIDFQPSKTISDWFVAPLLTASQCNILSKTEPIPENQPVVDESAEISSKIEATSPERPLILKEKKESEMETVSENSEFIPLPVIGPRTAGLSYIGMCPAVVTWTCLVSQSSKCCLDPTIEINKNTLKLRFPKTHGFADPEPPEEVQEPKIKALEMNCDSLMQSQASMMMHTVRSSLNEPLNELRTEPLTVNDIHRDIAQMDAQLANLSMLCTNIQTQYYDINKVEIFNSMFSQ